MEGAPVLILLAVLCVDALAAVVPPVRVLLGVPQKLISGSADWLRTKLDRPNRSAGTRRWRGAIAVFVLGAIAWGLGRLVEFVSYRSDWGSLIIFLALLVLIQTAGIIRQLRNAAAALAASEPARAWAELDSLTRAPDTNTRSPGNMSAQTLAGGWCRFIEIGITAAFWFLLLGLPGLFVVRTISLVTGAFARTDETTGEFALIPSRLEDVLSVFPSILAWPLIAASALFVPGCNPGRAFGAGLGEIASGWNRPGFRCQAGFIAALNAPSGVAALARGSWVLIIFTIIAALLLASSVLVGR